MSAYDYIYYLMDISKLFKRRKVLQNNQGCFDLELCRYKEININYSRKKEICNIEHKGYVLGCWLMKDTVYVVVGPD